METHDKLSRQTQREVPGVPGSSESTVSGVSAVYNNFFQMLMPILLVRYIPVLVGWMASRSPSEILYYIGWLLGPETLESFIL